MRNFKALFLTILAVGTLTLSSCLHIVEELTVRNNGSGTYSMTLDMGEMKSLMDMFQGMSGDSLPEGEDAGVEQNQDMTNMGEQMSAVAQSLKGLAGISNIVEINDTSTFRFGYTFDFADVAALNKAMRIINKEKYDSKVDEVFKFSGKNFERLSAGDLGEEIKKALAEGEENDEEGGMDMVKTFFSDMTYKQVYNFPDRKIKKSSNGLSEVSEDGHSVTITLKPFDEEQQKKKISIGTVVKLK